jgi:hypothetical protein
MIRYITGKKILIGHPYVMVKWTLLDPGRGVSKRGFLCAWTIDSSLNTDARHRGMTANCCLIALPALFVRGIILFCQPLRAKDRRRKY